MCYIIHIIFLLKNILNTVLPNNEALMNFPSFHMCNYYVCIDDVLLQIVEDSVGILNSISEWPPDVLEKSSSKWAIFNVFLFIPFVYCKS